MVSIDKDKKIELLVNVQYLCEGTYNASLENI